MANAHLNVNDATNAESAHCATTNEYGKCGVRQLLLATRPIDSAAAEAVAAGRSRAASSNVSVFNRPAQTTRNERKRVIRPETGP